MGAKTMKVGDIEKVLLPGESPWAEVIEIYPDGSWLGRIINLLLGGQDGFGDHNYSVDDLVVCDKPYLANRGIMVSSVRKRSYEH
jgi:hypothetical protein